MIQDEDLLFLIDDVNCCSLLHRRCVVLLFFIYVKNIDNFLITCGSSIFYATQHSSLNGILCSQC